MRIPYEWLPGVEKVLQFTHRRLDEFAIGDYCEVLFRDPDDGTITGQRFKVLQIHYGTLSKKLFGWDLALPEFLVTDINTGEEKNLIYFRLGAWENSGRAHALSRPTQIHPFAECCRISQSGFSPSREIYDVEVRKMDKVVIKEYLEACLSSAYAEKARKELLQQKCQLEQYESEKQNAAISEDELQTLWDLLQKEKK